MTQRFYLPPGFIIRRAKGLADRWNIQQLLLTWDDRFPNSSVSTQGKTVLIFLLLFWLILNPVSFIIVIAIALCSNFLLLQDTNNFFIIERNGDFIACGELRNYQKHSVLVNVFVKKEFRHQKIGSCLIEHITQSAKKPLYLCCYNELIPFYNRFGFIVISRHQVPVELRTELGLNGNLPVIPLVLLI